MNARASIVSPVLDDEWICPLEMVLAVTRSWFKSAIQERCRRGDVPDQAVRVFAHKGQLFAVIRWVDGGHEPLTVALEVFVGEPGKAA